MNEVKHLREYAREHRIALVRRPEHPHRRYIVFVEVTAGAAGRIEFISVLHQQTAGVEQVGLLKCVAGGYEHPLGRHVVAHGYHRSDKGLVEAVAEAAHLACGSHIHAQQRVGLLQTGEGELAGLHAHVAQVEGIAVRLLRMESEHSVCSKFYQVDLEHLGYEREAAGSPEVAFDDLYVVLLGEELYVERSGDMQFGGDARCHLFDAAHRLDVEFLGREDYGRVA